LYKRKTYRQKLYENHGLPRVQKITSKQSRVWGEGTIAIPAPLEVDEEIRKIPKGKVANINTLRKRLAKKHHATVTCPIVTGISVNISAHAAEEERKEGKKRITPWWRVLKGSGELNEKFPGGTVNHMIKLKSEGHSFVVKGKKTYVQDYEKFCIK
jgi:hypothetical protein